MNKPITQDDVRQAQYLWAEGIMDIGRIYNKKGDYVARARQHVETLYAYDYANVLFKPTLASHMPFRTNIEEALSYYVGGCVEEDRGFAITPWKKVRFGKQRIVTYGNHAHAMGHYHFTPHHGSTEQIVEFSFGYLNSTDGALRITLHHSSLPYQP